MDPRSDLKVADLNTATALTERGALIALRDQTRAAQDPCIRWVCSCVSLLVTRQRLSSTYVLFGWAGQVSSGGPPGFHSSGEAAHGAGRHKKDVKAAQDLRVRQAGMSWSCGSTGPCREVVKPHVASRLSVNRLRRFEQQSTFCSRVFVHKKGHCDCDHSMTWSPCFEGMTTPGLHLASQACKRISWVIINSVHVPSGHLLQPQRLGKQALHA